MLASLLCGFRTAYGFTHTGAVLLLLLVLVPAVPIVGLRIRASSSSSPCTAESVLLASQCATAAVTLHALIERGRPAAEKGPPPFFTVISPPTRAVASTACLPQACTVFLRFCSSRCNDDINILYSRNSWCSRSSLASCEYQKLLSHNCHSTLCWKSKAADLLSTAALSRPWRQAAFSFRHALSSSHKTARSSFSRLDSKKISRSCMTSSRRSSTSCLGALSCPKNKCRSFRSGFSGQCVGYKADDSSLHAVAANLSAATAASATTAAQAATTKIRSRATAAPTATDLRTCNSSRRLSSSIAAAAGAAETREERAAAAEEEEAEALHRAAGLEVWGELLPLMPLAVDDQQFRESQQQQQGGAEFLAQLPEQEVILFDCSSSHNNSMNRKGCSGGRSRGRWTTSSAAASTAESRTYMRQQLQYLAFPLDTLLFYLVVSPSDGLLFLRDGEPYFSSQHLLLQLQSQNGSLLPLSPLVDKYDLRYAHHCVKQAVARAAMRLQQQLEQQLLQRESEAAVAETLQRMHSGLSSAGVGHNKDSNSSSLVALEEAEGGVRGFYELASQRVDDFFAALYTRLPPSSQQQQLHQKLGAAAAAASSQRGPAKVQERAAVSAIEAVALGHDRLREPQQSQLALHPRQQQQSIREQRLQQATQKLGSIWREYRQSLFTDDEIPPFQRLEIVWRLHNNGGAKLVQVREAEGTSTPQSHPANVHNKHNNVSSSIRNTERSTNSYNQGRYNQSSDGEEEKESSATAAMKTANIRETRRSQLLLRLPTLVFHEALAGGGANLAKSAREAAAAGALLERVQRWAVLQAMLALYELLLPDAYTLVGGTNLLELRRILRKQQALAAARDRLPYVRMHSQGVPSNSIAPAVSQQHDEEIQAEIAACCTSAAVVASARLRQKRLQILLANEEQEAHYRKAAQAAAADLKQLQQKFLMMPFEWLEGPVLDSFLPSAQQQRVLGSWLGLGFSRRYKSDIFEQLLTSKTSFSSEEALDTFACMLRRWPRRPAVSEAEARAHVAQQQEELQDKQVERRGSAFGNEKKAAAAEAAAAVSTGAAAAAIRGNVAAEEEDGEGVFPVQQRALVSAMVTGGLDKAAAVVEPLSSRLHAQIVGVAQQIQHIQKQLANTAPATAASALQGMLQSQAEQEQKTKEGKFDAGLLLLRAEEQRGGAEFLFREQRRLLNHLQQQQQQQLALLNFVERKLLTGTFLFLDEAARLLHPSATNAVLDVAKISETYTSGADAPSYGGSREQPPLHAARNERESGTPHGGPMQLFVPEKLLQTFVDVQLFIYDVFRSLRAVLYEQLQQQPSGGPNLCANETQSSTQNSLSSAQTVPYLSFPSFSEGPSSEPREKEEEEEAAGSMASSDRVKETSRLLTPSEVLQYAATLINFFEKNIFDDMLPKPLQLRFTSHLHALSATAAVPARATRVHPLAIPLPAASAAIGEASGRPWKMHWLLYIHEAVRDPVLLAYAVLTGLFDIWKQAALPPRLPFIAAHTFRRTNEAAHTADSVNTAKLAKYTATARGGGASACTQRIHQTEEIPFEKEGASRDFPQANELQKEIVATTAAKAASAAAAAASEWLERRTAKAEAKMSSRLGCCFGLRKWSWIRSVSEKSSWPFFVGLYGTEILSDLMGASHSAADAAASVSPWLRALEERLLMQACVTNEEKHIIAKFLRPSAGEAMAETPSSFFGRLVSSGVCTPERAAALVAAVLRRPSASLLPHTLPSFLRSSSTSHSESPTKSHSSTSHSHSTTSSTDGSSSGSSREKRVFEEAVRTAELLRSGVDYGADAVDDASRFRGGADDEDEEEFEQQQQQKSAITRAGTTAATAAALAAQSRLNSILENGEDRGECLPAMQAAAALEAAAAEGGAKAAAEKERKEFFALLYSKWTVFGTVMQRELLHALWGNALFEAAAAAAAGACGPEALNSEEVKCEERVDVWRSKLGERFLKEAAEAAYRLRLRENACKGPVHSAECIHSPSFLCHLSPPPASLSSKESQVLKQKQQPSRQAFSITESQQDLCPQKRQQDLQVSEAEQQDQGEKKRGEQDEERLHGQQQYSSELHRETAQLLRDWILIEHQQQHVQRMRTVKLLAACKQGGDCPVLFEQLIGEAALQQQRQRGAAAALKQRFSEAELDQITAGTEVEKEQAAAGKRLLHLFAEQSKQNPISQALFFLPGSPQQQQAANELFHYFNVYVFRRSLPPYTLLRFTRHLSERSRSSGSHPSLAEYELSSTSFLEPPTIWLDKSIRSIAVLAHALLQQMLLLTAGCYDALDCATLSPPEAVDAVLWKYFPLSKKYQEHIAPPPSESSLFGRNCQYAPAASPLSSLRSSSPSNSSAASNCAAGHQYSKKVATPLPASFSTTPPSASALIRFAGDIPALLQQQQHSLGLACREVSSLVDDDPTKAMAMQSKLLVEARKAAAAVTALEHCSVDKNDRSNANCDTHTHTHHHTTQRRSARLTATHRTHTHDETHTAADTSPLDAQHMEQMRKEGSVAAERDIIAAAAEAVKAVMLQQPDDEAGADAVLDAMKQRRLEDLEEEVVNLAEEKKWPFYVKAPGSMQSLNSTGDNARERSSAAPAAAKANAPHQLQRSPPDWQELLDSIEMLKLLKYAVIDREGIASPSLYSDLILSGACTPERAMEIMEQALTLRDRQ